MEGQVREVVEVNEEMLAPGRGVIKSAAVDQGGVGGEPALRTADIDLLTAQRPVEPSGEGVDRMALRHVRWSARSP